MISLILTMISSEGEQWGRYNFPIDYICNAPISRHFSVFGFTSGWNEMEHLTFLWPSINPTEPLWSDFWPDLGSISKLDLLSHVIPSLRSGKNLSFTNLSDIAGRHHDAQDERRGGFVNFKDLLQDDDAIACDEGQDDGQIPGLHVALDFSDTVLDVWPYFFSKNMWHLVTSKGISNTRAKGLRIQGEISLFRVKDTWIYNTFPGY